MAKGAYQKLKLLYLQQILLENTDGIPQHDDE